MCRNIRPLFNFEPPATDDEIRAASLQFVRKISGFQKPSQANEAAFNEADNYIAKVAGQLLISLETSAAAKKWEAEAACSSSDCTVLFIGLNAAINSQYWWDRWIVQPQIKVANTC